MTRPAPSMVLIPNRRWIDDMPPEGMHPRFRAFHRFHMILMWTTIASVAAMVGLLYGAFWLADVVRTWRGH